MAPFQMLEKAEKHSQSSLPTKSHKRCCSAGEKLPLKKQKLKQQLLLSCREVRREAENESAVFPR
jgi:hypothetical protein